MSLDPERSGRSVKLRLDINWKISLFSLVMLPLLIGLGYWQLGRAYEKQNIQEALEQRQAAPPLDWQQYEVLMDGSQALQYRRVRLTGRYDDDHSWLVENKTHNGQIGYHVVTPFISRQGEALLVNRGWVVGTGYRSEKPDFLTPPGELTLEGQLVRPSENRLLKNAEQAEGSWPRLTLAVDPEVFSGVLGRKLMPHVLILDDGQPGAFVPKWVATNMTPQKHLGYALQWFSMAGALSVLTLVANSNLAQIIKNMFSGN